MRQKISVFIIICFILSIGAILGACKHAATAVPAGLTIIPNVETQAETPTPTAGKTTETIGAPASGEPNPSITGTGIPYPNPSDEGEIPTLETTLPVGYPPPFSTETDVVADTPKPSLTEIPSSPTSTASNTVIPASPSSTPSSTISPGMPYPGPDSSNPYPAPVLTTTSQAYPGPETTASSPTSPSPTTSTPGATQTPSSKVSATATTMGTILPTATPSRGTATPTTKPVEVPPRPPLSPPPPGSSVTIWHSWGINESKALQAIIQSFQRLYPEVTFSLLYVPQDDLYNSFYDAAYLGQGPSLLLGPSKWGPDLFNEYLITDLEPYVPVNFLESINPSALASGVYSDSLISLPLSQHGLLLFRNTSLITMPPVSFDELEASSLMATHGGVVGSYLERGSFFSSPAIIGLGGQLMDHDGYPAFNDQYGLEWFDLLEAYDDAGAVTFNTNWDLERFKQARVGIIIDGSWNISALAQSIGADNLAIDPWPSYGTGTMSGWVETDNIFLNANTTGNNRFAALSFMGYLLDPNVQMHLAEVGHIPTVITTQPRDEHFKQAMVAFIGGVPYPITENDELLRVYWDELDKAIRDVFDRGIDPSIALKSADQNIRISLDEMETNP